MLVYFRSQHDNQSWLAALTAILDASAFAIASLEGACVRQAQLTFAITRHAIVDLALVLHTSPSEPESSRLPPADLAALRSMLTTEGLQLQQGPDVDKRLNELRLLYEPYIHAISKRLLLAIPPWIIESRPSDNWQVSAWGQSAGFRRPVRGKKRDGGHF